MVLGFSGGPDSLALLHALHALNQPLVVAHFDHSLRPESTIEAERTAKVADSLGLPFVTERADVAGYASQNKFSVEEAARQLRYEFIFRVAVDQKAAAVTVAHNADDQVETVLMHLLRGAGSDGLRGMAYRALPNAWSERIPLVRPLLGVWRSEIEEYCEANQLEPSMDPSNSDPSFFRNRLRQELVPLMESYVPGFKRRLTQTAELVRADTDWLAALNEEAWRAVLAERGAGFIRLDRPAWLAQPLALKRTLLRRAVSELRPDQRDLDFDAVERAIRIIETGSLSLPVDWLAGLFLLIEGDRIWITDWDAELPVDWPMAPEVLVNVEVPFDLDLGCEWKLSAGETGQRSGDAKGQGSNGAGENTARVDLDVVGEELTIRRRSPGDRFQPLGMEQGSLKLSDFMINEKMPRRARDTWPLVCKGNEIVWVPGYRLAHAFRVTEKTKRVLKIELAKKSKPQRH